MEKTARKFIPGWTVNLIVILFGFAMVAQPYVIPTSSMENKLLIGDYVLVDKMAYAPPGSWLLPYRPVERGDIIVFQHPADLKLTLVKRVIGVPGDRIRIEAKQVYLNGRPLEEPYKIHRMEGIESYRDIFPGPPQGPATVRALAMLRDHVVSGELVVPEGNYFAMGDNRDVSLDSRYWGFVPRENIIGKPALVLWSFDAPTEQLVDGSRRIEHLADVAMHFVTKTRWSRTLEPVRGYPLH